MNLLMDDYRASGQDMETFEKEIKKLTLATKVTETRGGYISLLSLCEPYEDKENDKTGFYIFDRVNLDNFLIKLKMAPIGRVSISKTFGSMELYEEMADTGICFIDNQVLDNVFYVVSKHTLGTLSRWSGVGGDETISHDNIIRDMHLADAITRKNEKTSFLYREETFNTAEAPVTVRKIFGIMGKSYTYTPQTVLVDAIKQLEGMEVINWETTHASTTVYAVDTSSKGFIKKGIRIKTSDIGKSSLNVARVYFFGKYDNVLVADEQGLKHTSEITCDDIVDAIEKLEEKENIINFFNADTTTPLLTNSTNEGATYIRFSGLCEKLVNKTMKDIKVPAKWQRALLDTLEDTNLNSVSSLQDVGKVFVNTALRYQGDMDEVTMENVRRNLCKVPMILQTN